jgi:DNA adenine methylase
VELLEPFAGGGIVSLTAVFEGLVRRATLVELDEDVAAVWLAMLNGHGSWLAECIAKFKLTPDSVKRVLANRARSLDHRAFATIVKNRVTRGGILAPGAGFVKLGENGRGLTSRWYPATLSRRILQIAARRDRLAFMRSDGMQVLREWSARPGVIYFIDPPYTVAAKRLYQHWDVDHDRLFTIASRLKGDFLMTYDDAEEIRALAEKHGFASRAIVMKTTHHRQKAELLIGRTLGWLDG